MSNERDEDNAAKWRVFDRAFAEVTTAVLFCLGRLLLV